jgi:hypothetical protein
MLAAAMGCVGGLAIPAPAEVFNPVDCQRSPATCVVAISTPGEPGGTAGPAAASCRDLSQRLVPCFLPGKGWYGGDGCWYEPATGADLQLAVGIGGRPMPPAAWWVGSCGNPAENFWPILILRVVEATPESELLDQPGFGNRRSPCSEQAEQWAPERALTAGTASLVDLSLGTVAVMGGQSRGAGDSGAGCA